LYSDSLHAQILPLTFVIPPELEGSDYYIQLASLNDRFIILKKSMDAPGSITYHLNSATRGSSDYNPLDPEARGANIALSVSREHCPEKHGRVTVRTLRDVGAGEELLWVGRVDCCSCLRAPVAAQISYG
jgi:hypothetical protein